MAGDKSYVDGQSFAALTVVSIMQCQILPIVPSLVLKTQAQNTLSLLAGTRLYSDQ